MHKTYNRFRTGRLWNIDPHCHWCGIKTVLSELGKARNEDDTASFDHWYTVLDEERWEGANENVGALSCRKCNSERGATRLASHLSKTAGKLTKRQEFEVIYYGKVLTK